MLEAYLTMVSGYRSLIKRIEFSETVTELSYILFSACDSLCQRERVAGML